jgi:hypothetical protein
MSPLIATKLVHTGVHYSTVPTPTTIKLEPRVAYIDSTGDVEDVLVPNTALDATTTAPRSGGLSLLSWLAPSSQTFEAFYFDAGHHLINLTGVNDPLGPSYSYRDLHVDIATPITTPASPIAVMPPRRRAHIPGSLSRALGRLRLAEAMRALCVTARVVRRRLTRTPIGR